MSAMHFLGGEEGIKNILGKSKAVWAELYNYFKAQRTSQQ